MWLKHDVETRSNYLPELIKIIRLNLLTIEYLDHNVQEEDLIKSNLKCTPNCMILIFFSLLGFCLQVFIVTKA